MGLFDWFSGAASQQIKQQDAERLARQQQSARQLKGGGLPIEAMERLSTQASRQDTPQHLWTGNLSVNELLLTRQCGFVPLGQVMGTSVYQIGIQWRSGAWRNSFWRGEGAGYELDILTQGFLQARGLALGRLKQEAELLGATGILGVEITHKKTDWESGLLEFSALGTAIRETHFTRAGSTRINKPPLFLSELSGQEYWQFLQAGFRPVGIAIGYCVFCQMSNLQTENTVGGSWFNARTWQNIELTDFTQGLYSARALAMQRMQEDALAVHANGIVSVSTDTKVEFTQANSNTRQKMIYHFSAIGTAIEEFPMSAGRSTPDLTVSLGTSQNNLP